MEEPTGNADLIPHNPSCARTEWDHYWQSGWDGLRCDATTGDREVKSSFTLTDFDKPITVCTVGGRWTEFHQHKVDTLANNVHKNLLGQSQQKCFQSGDNGELSYLGYITGIVIGYGTTSQQRPRGINGSDTPATWESDPIEFPIRDKEECRGCNFQTFLSLPLSLKGIIMKRYLFRSESSTSKQIVSVSRVLIPASTSSPGIRVTLPSSRGYYGLINSM